MPSESMIALLESAKETSGKKMVIQVHVPNQTELDDCKLWLKGKRGYKRVKPVLALGGPND